MRILAAFLLCQAWFCEAMLCQALPAQSRPDFSGVWTLVPGQSEIRYSPSAPWHAPLTPVSMVLKVEHKEPVITEMQEVFAGEQATRRQFRFRTDGQETVSAMRGVPMTVKASWREAGLTVEARHLQFNGSVRMTSENWSLSADGATLKITHREETENQDTLVFRRGTSADGERFAKPNPMARQQRKNIQVLDVELFDLPNVMLGYRGALGVECSHCHVPNQWELDDKPAKKTARKMIEMTATFNKSLWNEEARVTCYTCHRGKLRPSTAPAGN